MKVCSSSEMHRIDALAAEKFNIPTIVLMENAASACVSEIIHFNSFTVICGKGNNGGDGLAISRRLINMGKDVKVYLAMGDVYSGDALINYNILKSMGAEIKCFSDTAELENDMIRSECVVDALFGTGIKGEVKSPAREIIESINKCGKYVLSVDVPSGINSDSGKVEGTAVKADKTVTFAAYKKGMLLYPAADFVGETIVADISIPTAAFDICNVKINTIDPEYVQRVMPKRSADSHKGDYGRIFVIGGSVGMAGAVCLACNAAFKTGAGIVTACVPKKINDIVQISVPQAMTFPADFEKDADRIIEKMADYDVILFGNGIGREKCVQVLLERVLHNASVPVVIDADGLYALAQDAELLKNTKAPVILTPHSGEMARLAGISAAEVENRRIEVAEEFSKNFGVTLVLKGNHSIISAPDGAIYVNLTGNSGMATAGSGDCLAGMVAALAAVSSQVDAAALAVYLHASAGDFAKEQLSEASLTSVDIINAISHILPVEKELKM